MPVLIPIGIELGVLLSFCVLYALCRSGETFTRAIFGTARGAVAWIPWVGRVTAGALHDIESKIVGILSAAAMGLERRIGSLWHATASLADSAFDAIRDNARTIAEVASFLPGMALAKPLYDAIAGLKKGQAVTRVYVRTVVHDHTVTKVIAKSAAHTATVAKVRAQAIPADVVVPGDLAGIRARTRTVEHEIGRLWEWTRAHSRAVVGGIALGALVSALGRLGLGWIRCSKVKRLGRRACGMDESLITDLIEDSLIIVGGFSLLEFAEVMGDLAHEATVAINDFAR